MGSGLEMSASMFCDLRMARPLGLAFPDTVYPVAGMGTNGGAGRNPKTDISRPDPQNFGFRPTPCRNDGVSGGFRRNLTGQL